MFTNSKLAKSIRLVMAAGVASTAMISSNAVFAQETPNAEEEASLEKISVTGSRIKRIDVENASPVTIIGRADLEISGLTDIGDFLQSIPSMSGSPIGSTTNNGGNGSVQIDLRGLGTARTLTLVNGKRVVDGGDFQAIPSAMIEQVEILKDGASAVYGADAVAGVVNIITKKDDIPTTMGKLSVYFTSVKAKPDGGPAYTDVYVKHSIPMAEMKEDG